MNRTHARPRLIGEVLREIFTTAKRTRKNRRQRSKGGEK